MKQNRKILKKNLKTITSILLLIAIGLGILEIFNIEKKKINEENSQIREASELPLPSKIIYKNKYNKYKVMNSEDKYFAEVYTLLYNQSADYTDDEPELEKENIGFVECTYIVRNPSEEKKNYIFLLGNENSDLEKKIQFYTEDSQEYEFKKEKSYTSKKQVSEIPTDAGFLEQEEGIYKTTRVNNEVEYKMLLQQLGFTIDDELPDVDYDNQNVIIIMSKYEIKNVEANIGNIKYELGTKSDKYFVNCLIYSKVVNDACIYYNIDE